VLDVGRDKLRSRHGFRYAPVAPGQKIIPRCYCCQPICAIAPALPRSGKPSPETPGAAAQNAAHALSSAIFGHLYVYPFKEIKPPRERLAGSGSQKLQYLCGFQAILKRCLAARGDASIAHRLVSAQLSIATIFAMYTNQRPSEMPPSGVRTGLKKYFSGSWIWSNLREICADLRKTRRSSNVAKNHRLTPKRVPTSSRSDRCRQRFWFR